WAARAAGAAAPSTPLCDRTISLVWRRYCGMVVVSCPLPVVRVSSRQHISISANNTDPLTADLLFGRATTPASEGRRAVGSPLQVRTPCGRLRAFRCAPHAAYAWPSDPFFDQ